MKGRKRLGRKKRRKGLSKKESLYGILFAVVIISILFIYFLVRSPLNQTNETFQFKAAIVDHLSLTAPNQTFIQTATNILKTAGFTVDYYPGEEVTVEFYRKLPTHHYDLIVLRVHSALKQGEQPPVLLFTSQPYSEMKYVYEQSTGQIGIVAFAHAHEGDPIYFGISPEFIKRSMNGRFENTIIVMMGCYGLEYDGMAEAFVEKGAKVYIGWNEGVSAFHTDKATTHLLKHLITQKQTIKQAVTETMNEVGPDPADGSILLYYPTTPEAEDYVIPEPKSNLTTNVAETNPKIEKLKDEC